MARPPKQKRLSPREKKDISLAKDQRDDWWEYETKGCRSKARAGKLRIARRAGKVHLNDDLEKNESRFQLKLKKRWKKTSGVSLGESVVFGKNKRIETHGARKKRHGRHVIPRSERNED